MGGVVNDNRGVQSVSRYVKFMERWCL